MSDSAEPTAPPPARDTPADHGTQTARVRLRPASGPLAAVEHVVLALVLAFVFRAFVVEAFIIPTGSMADTLMGAHMRFDCADCGYTFPVNYATPAGASAALLPRNAVTNAGAARVFNVRCLNCGFRLPPEPQPGLRDASETSKSPPVYYGDRILVLKHQHLFRDPERFEVVVFKNPSLAAIGYPQLRPEQATNPYQENYIKRLVGLPGETLLLLDGDVYAARGVRHKETRELQAADFEIRRKPPHVQKGLWRTVYDDDYRPRGIDRDFVATETRRVYADTPFELPWRPSGGWQVEPRGFSVSGAGVLRFDPDANPLAYHLSDYLAYNQTWNDRRASRNNQTPFTFGPAFEFRGGIGGSSRGGPWLHHADDLRVSLVHTRRTGDGPFTIRMTGNEHAFSVTLTPGALTLLDEMGRTVMISYTHRQDGLSAVGSSTRLEVEHADYAVVVRVDGREIVRQPYEPDVASLIEAEARGDEGPRPTVEFIAGNHDADVRHVKLFRDVYYTSRDQLGGGVAPGGFHPHASPDDFPNNAIRLGDDAYFVVGDNPMLSGDARTWDADRDAVVLRHERLVIEGGRVPGRFLLGKAFFVYWPGGYRPLPFLPPVVPNFGDMRMIR